MHLAGTIVPLVTPFRDDESLDLDTLATLAEFHAAKGAAALMPTALTGDGPLLSEEETIQAWDVVFQASGIPVIPAIVSTRTQNAMRLADAAAQRGAAALMAAPVLPELYAGRSADDALGFYRDIARVSGLPLILFNYPSLTGIDLTSSLVARFSEIENVRYIKESTGEAWRVHSIHRQAPRIQVICGSPVTALESFALGCRAWITGILNVVPEAGTRLMDAVLCQRDLAQARDIYYRRILPLADRISETNNPSGVIRAGLAARGIDCGPPRRPAHPLRGDAVHRLTAMINTWENE